MKRIALLVSAAVVMSLLSSYPTSASDVRQKEAKYVHKVQKHDEKEKYERKKYGVKPSGFMTLEEYNELSKYTEEPAKEDIPKVKNSEMKYVPEPTYKIVRYNDPPGSPELNITTKFYKLHQFNGQGVTSPDYTMTVYPVVYYYPNTQTTASDLFVIMLDETGSPLTKIKDAKASNRLPDPIISTDRSIDTNTAFRSLTPVDFSEDSRKLLAKEKIGSSHDGIWRTNAIVYDFDTKTSYNLVEVRDAISYYWKENKNLDLDDCRWDIYPLGFLKNEPDRIAVNAYGFTGDLPVNLGIWSVDIHGEQSRLIAFDQADVEFGINGFKLVQDGVVPKTIVKKEQKALVRSEKSVAKKIKKAEKEKLNAMKQEYKDTIKEIDWYYKENMKDLKKLDSLKGTTSANDLPEAFREYKLKELPKDINNIEKQLKQEEMKMQKLEKDLN